MTNIAITGANGFIGRELCQVARAHGIGVFSLSRRSEQGGGAIRWQLGEPLPEECKKVDAVVHLASAAFVETTSSMAEAAECDLVGSRILVESVRRLRSEGRRIRFVYISSQSARAEAANAYGRSKWVVESMLDEDDEIIVRPGLVYGDHAASIFAVLTKLASFPIIPVVARDANIQPIHVQDLADCITQIATMKKPPQLFQLGAINAITFKDFVRATARRAGRRQPLTIPIPAYCVRFMARLIDRAIRRKPSLTERIEGLLALQPMDTRPSLALLDHAPRLLTSRIPQSEQGASGHSMRRMRDERSKNPGPPPPGDNASLQDTKSDIKVAIAQHRGRTPLSYDLCIVIPAYNEAVAIADTIRDYKATFPGAVVVVIDNNSTDDTVRIAEANLEKRRDFLLTERRQGKGAAVKTGLSRVAADVYILVDGDGTYPARDAAQLLAILEQRRCDMVVGDRVSAGIYAKQNTRSGHSQGNRFLTWFISFLTGQKYSDVLSGLRVMSRPFINMLDVRSFGFQLESELNIVAAYLRADVVEAPIDYLPRRKGSDSKLNTMRDGLKIIALVLINWIAFFPLQSFSILAAAAFIISGLLGFNVFMVYLRLGSMPYAATAIAAAAAGLVGLQSIFTGLLLRILMRANRRADIARLLHMRREWNARLDA